MPKSIQEWLAEGEELYAATLAEYHELENQISELEQKLAAKHTEVNKLAQIIGKPPVEGRKVLTAQLVGGPAEGGAGANIPAAHATIARALSGRGLGR
ncbi:MAG: hypothetical protein ACK4PI_05040 [Tepidisphaerales bacterium]